jgi:uncharacterized membrane protein YhhN
MAAVTMNGTASVLFGVALVIAAVDWFAVARGVQPLEYVCKPAAALAFLAAAATLDPASGTARAWFCVALVACLVGDVFLMLPLDAFVAGLASFAVAQVCFAVGFAHQRPTPLRLAIGVVVVLLVTTPLAMRFVRALRATGDRSLVPPVIAYVAVIGAMAASALAGGDAWGVAGALLFLVSDSLIAEDRFVAPHAWSPVAVMVTYHLALAGLVVGLV